jgi:multicomponent Na+:H+ antiporter subunit E
MTRRWPVFGVALAVLWLLVRGVPVDPVGESNALWADVAGEFLIGLAVGMPVAFGLRRLYTDTIDLGRLPAALPPATVYLALFLTELVTANVDVARRVLSPDMPIDPDVVEIPLRVETDLAVTTIANSITLTPGTLTMDYDEERNAVYVHAIACTDPKDVVDPIRHWEDYALRIFDEDGSPDDRPRRPRIHERAGDYEGVAHANSDPEADPDAASETDRQDPVEHGGDDDE